MNANNISVASPTTNGTCSITPSNGTSLETYFNLSCSDWESVSTPLSYLFQYQVQDGLHGLLYNGSNNSINSWLPSGKLSWNYTVKCSVTVTDKNGVCAPTVNLFVQVQYIFDYMNSCITLQMNKALIKRPMIVDDSWSAHSHLTTNYYTLSSTIINYHSFRACSNSSRWYMIWFFSFDRASDLFMMT